MQGLDTEQIMAVALDLVGETEIPLDSGIHHPGRNIKRILFSMDVNVGLLQTAKQLGFDAVIGHHPCGALVRQGEVYRKHIDIMASHGIPRQAASEAIGDILDRVVFRMWNRRFRMLYIESANNTVLETDAARLLDMPFMNIHNLFDEQGRRILQAKLDAAARRADSRRLKDVLQLIEDLPEARAARDDYGIRPVIFIGDPDAEASKTVFVHGALSAPHPEIIRCYWKNGPKTVVILHNDTDSLENLQKNPGGNLILTGHFLGDSIGMTPFIHALRKKGLEVVCMGGIIDAA